MALSNGYVRFLRGTLEQYNNLKSYRDDTLYFVTAAADSSVGQLFLGDVEISGGSSGVAEMGTLGELKNVVIDAIADKQILVYDVQTQKWVNRSIDELIEFPQQISIMKGASADEAGVAGLVPVPPAGAQGKFLRGDGTWVSIDLGGPDGMLDSLEERIELISNSITDLESALENLGDVSDLEQRVANLEFIINDQEIEENGETSVVFGLQSVVSKLVVPKVEDHETRIATIESTLQWKNIVDEIS